MNEQQQPRNTETGYVPYAVFIDLHARQEERYKGDLNDVRNRIEQVQSRFNSYATKDDLAQQTLVLRMEIGSVKNGVEGVSSDVSGVHTQIGEVKTSLIAEMRTMAEDIKCVTKEQSEQKSKAITEEGERKLSTYKRLVAIQAIPITLLLTLAVTFIVQHFLH